MLDKGFEGLGAALGDQFKALLGGPEFRLGLIESDARLGFAEVLSTPKQPHHARIALQAGNKRDKGNLNGFLILVRRLYGELALQRAFFRLNGDRQPRGISAYTIS